MENSFPRLGREQMLESIGSIRYEEMLPVILDLLGRALEGTSSFRTHLPAAANNKNANRLYCAEIKIK